LLSDGEQNIRLAAPPTRDGCDRDSLSGSTIVSPAADCQLLSSAVAMFASKLAMTSPDQYEQMQQLVMQMQTSGLLHPSDNGAQVSI